MCLANTELKKHKTLPSSFNCYQVKLLMDIAIISELLLIKGICI